MKQLLSIILGLSIVLGVGKCSPNKEKPILESLDGTTWIMDNYITAERYPGVPEKYVGETQLYLEFGFNTVKRYSFEYIRYYDHDVVTGYEYPGYKETTLTYTLDGNQLTLLEDKDGEAVSSVYTIESPATMVHSSGVEYLKK